MAELDTAINQHEQQVKQLVADYFAATRAMDIEAWLKTMAPNIRSFDPVGTQPTEGLAAMRQYFAGIAGLCKKIGMTEQSIFVCGNQAAVKWAGQAVSRAGRTISFEGIDVFCLNPEGRIQEILAYWDPQVLLRELQA